MTTVGRGRCEPSPSRWASHAADVDAAEADGTLGLLIVERTVVAETGTYTLGEAAARSGLGDEARRFWRALGFPDPDPDERMFSEHDVEMLQLFDTILRLQLLDDDLALQMARVIGSSMQRVAQSQVDAIEARIDTDVERRRGAGRRAGPDAAADGAAHPRVRVAAPRAERGARGAWCATTSRPVRRHRSARQRRRVRRPRRLHGARRRRSTTTPSPPSSTASRRIAYDVVGARGGRVVKMIGDEVMFEALDPAAAVEIGARPRRRVPPRRDGERRPRRASPSVRRSPGKATSTAPPSTWPPGSSASPTPAAVVTSPRGPGRPRRGRTVPVEGAAQPPPQAHRSGAAPHRPLGGRHRREHGRAGSQARRGAQGADGRLVEKNLPTIVSVRAGTGSTDDEDE